MILTTIFFSYRSQNSGELFPKGPASNSIILKKVTLFQGIRQSEPRDPRSSKVYKVIRIQLQQGKGGGGGGKVIECFQSSWSGFNEFSCLLLLSIVRKGGYWLNVLWHKHKLKNRKKTKKNKGAGASEAHSQTKEDFSGRDTSRHLKDHWYSCCQTFVALIQPLLLRNSQNMVWLLEPSSKLVLFWFFSIQLLKKHVLNPEITLLYQFHAAKALFKVPIICNISFWIERDLPP